MHAGFTDNTSVNVYQAAEAGQVIALTEVPYTYRVRLSDLAALHREKPEGLGLDFMTAHPTLLGDGTLVNIGIAVRHRALCNVRGHCGTS